MKINTDLVKGKKYSSAVKPNTLKHSQEYRVLATLRYLYPSKFDTMITGEAPDLQDSASSTGIEVTAAVKEDDMKVSRAFSELNQGKPKDIEKRKKTSNQADISLFLLKMKRLRYLPPELPTERNAFFKKAYEERRKKIQQYRSNFKRMGLAILLPEIPTSYAENHLSEWITELLDESANLFDFVYVISHRFCLYYDMQAKKLKSVHSPKMKVCHSLRLAE